MSFSVAYRSVYITRVCQYVLDTYPCLVSFQVRILKHRDGNKCRFNGRCIVSGSLPESHCPNRAPDSGHFPPGPTPLDKNRALCNLIGRHFYFTWKQKEAESASARDRPRLFKRKLNITRSGRALWMGGGGGCLLWKSMIYYGNISISCLLCSDNATVSGVSKNVQSRPQVKSPFTANAR